nr:MAG TPA: hypothetical protein [Caudoviricetes sp.]
MQTDYVHRFFLLFVILKFFWLKRGDIFSDATPYFYINEVEENIRYITNISLL